MSLLGTLQTLSARGDAAERPCVDLSFELRGEELPRHYAEMLRAAVVRELPWMEEDPQAGIHPIRAPLTEAGYVLSRRARLQIRIDAARADAVLALSGKTLSIGERRLGIGSGVVKAVQAFPTLRAAAMVSRFDDEQAFVDDVEMQLEVLGVKGRVICGKPTAMQRGDRQFGGFAVVVHDLSGPHSLRLQAIGLGADRLLGCGLFVHHKIIEGLDAYPE